MATSPHKSTLDGLPKQFVSSLRVLFNILDEERTGYVKVGDIESRWEGSDVAGLPSGVLDALRKVTPPSGKITFERFVGGLKIALLRTQNYQYQPQGQDSASGTARHTHSVSDPVSKPTKDRLMSQSGQASHAQPNTLRPSSQSLSQVQKPASAMGPNMATVRPNNAIAQRTQSKSLSHLGLTPDDNGQTFSIQFPRPLDQQARAPPSISSRESAAEALQVQAWRKERISSSNAPPSQSLFVNRRPGDGRSSVASTSAPEPYGRNREFGSSKEAELLVGGRKSSKAKREDPRRHTVSNGIDYNMIKRMKQLEQEKDVLLQGLEAVERTKDWYHQQLSAVQEKQKYIGRGASPNEYSLDSYQETINLRTSWILQVNQHLKTLVDSSEKGLPLHMNLAVSSTPPKPTTNHRPILTNGNPLERDQMIGRLRSQNKTLSQELDQKSGRIEQLEREKAEIIKELFVNKASMTANKANSNYEYDDTTFI